MGGNAASLSAIRYCLLADNVLFHLQYDCAGQGKAAEEAQTRQRPLSGSIWLVSQARAN